MDLEFREPTEEERKFIIEKLSEEAANTPPIKPQITNSQSDSRSSSGNTISVSGILLFVFGFFTTPFISMAIFFFNIFMHSVLYWIIIAMYILILSGLIIAVIRNAQNRKQERLKKQLEEPVSVSATKNEVDNRIANATLKVADVTLVRREKIMTNKEDVYYVEIVDVNSVIGSTVEMHTTKDIYDGFEEGRDAYVVWWDFPDSSIGTDVWEIMIKGI